MYSQALIDLPVERRPLRAPRILPGEPVGCGHSYLGTDVHVGATVHHGGCQLGVAAGAFASAAVTVHCPLFSRTQPLSVVDS